MYNKKGLSAIVATVLIILLVIAGVTLVWAPVRKLLTDQSDDLEAKCLLVSPTITSACNDTTTEDGDLKITISNGAEGTMDNVQIIYGDDAGSLTSTNTPDPAEPIGINEIKTIIVDDAGATATAVKIAAIIGGETCTAGSVSTVTACPTA